MPAHGPWNQSRGFATRGDVVFRWTVSRAKRASDCLEF